MLDLAAVLALAQSCAPAVAPETLSAIAYVESRFNPVAIGVNHAPEPGPVRRQARCSRADRARPAGPRREPGSGPGPDQQRQPGLAGAERRGRLRSLPQPGRRRRGAAGRLSAWRSFPGPAPDGPEDRPVPLQHRRRPPRFPQRLRGPHRGGGPAPVPDAGGHGSASRRASCNARPETRPHLPANGRGPVVGRLRPLARQRHAGLPPPSPRRADHEIPAPAVAPKPAAVPQPRRRPDPGQPPDRPWPPPTWRGCCRTWWTC